MCGPVRESQPTTLSCIINTSGCTGTLLTWRAGGRDAVLCTNQGCFGAESSINATLSSTGSSILTINSVSKTDPFNMEVKWTCQPCNGDLITVCDKLEVYGEFSHCALFTMFFFCLYFCFYILLSFFVYIFFNLLVK